MAFFAVTVEEIDKVMAHPNADRLSLATVKGMSFQFVIGKDQFKSGDKVLYFPIDSLIPQELLTKIGLTGKLSGKDKNRVKTIKLRDEISQGLVVPAEKYLDKEMMSKTPQEITLFLGVEKYEPPIQMTQEGTLVALPDGYSTYDIEGADRYQNIIELMMDMDVVVFEKMEGTNLSAVKSQDQFFVNQRNNSILELPNVKNSYWEAVRSEGLMEVLQKSPEQNLAFYAEFCGPKIQGNIYQLKKHTLYVFDVKKDFKWVSYEEFKTLTASLKCPTAPVLFEGKLRDFLNGKTVQEASNGPSVVNPSTLREGIVIKPQIEQHHPKVGRLIIKQRSPLYLAGSEF